MSNKVEQIRALISSNSAAAPDVTKPLKDIGNGSMIEGVKNIFDYAYSEGERGGLINGYKYGFIKGSTVMLGICGVTYIIPKGITFLKDKASDIKARDEMGERIYAAFSEELIEAQDESNAVEEKEKNKSEED